MKKHKKQKKLLPAIILVLVAYSIAVSSVYTITKNEQKLPVYWEISGVMLSLAYMLQKFLIKLI